MLGLAYLAGTYAIPVFDAADSVGPRSFPFLIAAITIGCGLALIINDLRNKERKPFSWGFAAESGVWLRIAATMAAGIAYGLVLDWLGYLIATFIFMLIVATLIKSAGTSRTSSLRRVFHYFIHILRHAPEAQPPQRTSPGILPF